MVFHCNFRRGWKGDNRRDENRVWKLAENQIKHREKPKIFSFRCQMKVKKVFGWAEFENCITMWKTFRQSFVTKWHQTDSRLRLGLSVWWSQRNLWKIKFISDQLIFPLLASLPEIKKKSSWQFHIFVTKTFWHANQLIIESVVNRP